MSEVLSPASNSGRAPGAGAQSMRVDVPIRSLAAEAVLLAWLAIVQRPLMTAPDCPGLYRTWGGAASDPLHPDVRVNCQ